MDFIIIALWGLLAGGLIWSGTTNSDKADTTNKTTVTNMIEEPTNAVSRPKVVLTNDGKSDTNRKALQFNRETSETEAKDAVVVNHDTVVVFRWVAEDGTVYTTETAPEGMAEVIKEAEETIVTAAADPKSSDVTLPQNLSIEQLQCDEVGIPMIHVLKRGESLTQIAQRYYADACFWPYIFEVNRHKLSSPDKVQADMSLYLPDPKFYDIDGNNPESVAKAKNLGAKLKK